MRKFGYKVPFVTYVLMIASFALALLDMTMLRDSVGAILRTDIDTSSILAMAIATIANLFALDWGRENGRNKSAKKLNKNSITGFLGWVLFGLVYVILKITAAFKSGSVDWVTECAEFVILAASYIFSGLSIENSAREIWDADSSACRAAEESYNSQRKNIAVEDSKINKMLSSLENYNQNYDTLDRQYKKQQDAIRHAEDAVINTILGKTLQDNPSVLPDDAKKVIEQARTDNA